MEILDTIYLLEILDSNFFAGVAISTLIAILFILLFCRKNKASRIKIRIKIGSFEIGIKDQSKKLYVRATEPLKLYHREFLHPLREFAHYFKQHSTSISSLKSGATSNIIVQTGDHADAVCRGAAKSLARLLDEKEEKIRCCLKVFPLSGKHENKVQVWARSQHSGDPGGPCSEPRDILLNSPWCALLKKDEVEGAKWSKYNNINCFASPDITKHREAGYFQTDASSVYRSIMIFRCRCFFARDDFRILGFVQFDSPDENVFPGIPDIYDFISPVSSPHEKHANEQQYRMKLESTAVFHYGASISDTIGMALLSGFEAIHNKS